MRELEYPFDPDFILKNKLRLKRQLYQDGTVRIPIKIAVLGGSTTYDICKCLQLFLLNQGIEPIFYESEYNKFWEDAMFPNEKLEKFRPDIIYIHTSNRNITTQLKSTDTGEEINQKLEEQYQQFEKMWKKLREDYQCTIIQNNFERPMIRLYGNKDISDLHGFSHFLLKLNSMFYEFSQQVSWLYINDLEYISSVYGLEKWNDLSAWYLYKYAMSVDAIPDLCYNLSNIIKSLCGKNRKVLAVDLDNTLWGGIISEDGINGIELGKESAIGEMYGEIQDYLKKQKEIGGILAINSKNDISSVQLAFSHPDMKLSLNDFSAISVNWNRKDENIMEIAETLDIGLDSIVFVDDNPAEREIVKSTLPLVAVPELKEPEQYIKTINRAGYFEVTNLSDEDKKRTQMYQESTKRRLEKEKYGDYNEFLESLNMESAIRYVDECSIQRVTQLINKSNQFNLTTKRLSEDDIRRYINDNSYICLYGRLKDKFGDNGIVSVLIARKDCSKVHIEVFLMSCRVLRRGLEKAMLDELINILSFQKYDTVIGYYYKTKKNMMVEEFYQDMGFNLLENAEEGKKFFIKVKDYKKKNKIIRMV